MHFVGPDQLHGFEERLTTDIYPADFGWTPDYRKPGQRIDWWYHNLGSVTGAGVAEITNQLEYDDEVAHHARAQALRSGARPRRPALVPDGQLHPPARPLCRAPAATGISTTIAPISRRRCRRSPTIEQDPHSKRLFDANDWRSFDITAEDIARARRAYFANISYLDDKIGEILQVLEDTRQEAIVVFVSDHGDMLGERGLWFKMTFFEGACRVPLMIAAPGLPAGRIDAPVSTLDVTPTLGALAGLDLAEIAPWTDGEDLTALANGAERTSPVAMEYAAEGSRRAAGGAAPGANGNTPAARSTPSSSSISRPIRTN